MTVNDTCPVGPATTWNPNPIGGANVPQTFDAYRTSASENCVSAGNMANGAITLKADSVTTLVNGSTP